MKYTKQEAKAYARANFKGVWAAVLTPFDDELRVDEAGFRANIHHWFDTLKIAGLFVAGKQAEFFSRAQTPNVDRGRDGSRSVFQAGHYHLVF
jgi:4-hydroxy-tetrahydrodipicolinate synthase